MEMIPDSQPAADQRLGGRILVVDDEQMNVSLLEALLDRAGYRNVVSTTRPGDVASLMREFEPDLVLLDLMMPDVDGFEVMQLLRSTVPADSYLPILVLTADVTPETRRRALAAGARDFLTKPIDVDETLLRIANMLDVRFLHRQLQRERDGLEQRVQERTRELEEAQIETFERLALAAEYRDDDTGQHTIRVGFIAARIADKLGVPSDLVDLLQRAAALHDVGKIGVPDAILLAPRKLSVEEFEVVKTHTAIGAKILSGSRSPLLQMAEEIAWSHHERWDGGGYGGLAGEEIPIHGRITTVADVFDALTHERPYKKAWPIERAVAEIEINRGGQFDPVAVDAFLELPEDVFEVGAGPRTDALAGPGRT